ncbi:MAG TPA: hypothetical protein VGK26_11725 [Thermoanaerobaculia bacterium]
MRLRLVDDPGAAVTRRIRLVTRAILAVGFAAAVAVFVVAGARPEDPLNEQLTSKKYLHDLEVYGGKANVLAAEFRDWFAGLWYGRNLAGTIAVLTIVAALVYRFFATPLPPPEDEELEDVEKPRPGPRRL